MPRCRSETRLGADVVSSRLEVPLHERAPFYPPHVTPARLPLRFPFNLVKLLGNNLELIPEAAYHEPVVFAPGPPRMAFFTGPELVKELLLGVMWSSRKEGFR